MIAIIDYGMGNIYSIQSAIGYLGCRSVHTGRDSDIYSASHIILPGVGSYRKGMQFIKEQGLDIIIRNAVLEKRIPILGICLGMQLLCSSSTEDGYTEGLGLIQGDFEKFSLMEEQIKIPHVGFNNVYEKNKTLLLKGLSDSDFYFTHSYRMISCKSSKVFYCFNGEEFVAGFEKENIFGTQFHPEKSQANGLKLLINFLEYKS